MKNVALLILDGWGYARSWGGNAITIANTPTYDRLLRTYPNTLIAASGVSVGLPGHEMGNSEVGHMNIGAGRVIRQDISQINESILNDTFYINPVLKQSIQESKDKNTSVHLLGIVSDGGIHSHIVHLFALIKLCKIIGHKNVFIHAFTDGRDTDPMSGLEFINKITILTNQLKTGIIADVSGRFVLDRKGDWDKTKKAYEMLINGMGKRSKSALSAVSDAYRHGDTDEFIPPTIIDGVDGRIKENDTVIIYNFRSDRTRQLVQALYDKDFKEFQRTLVVKDSLVTFIPYGIEKELKIKSKSAFPTITVDKTLGGFYELNNLRQFHIAETEKYPHVTYFLNGNRELPYVGEERMIIPSPNVRTYDEKPEMSGEEVKENLLKTIKRKRNNLIICNFANPDMVGHTGNFNAAVKAVEFIDQKLKEVVECCIDNQTQLVITADHGNIEQMIDPATGDPYTEHTKNPVPLIIVADKVDCHPNNGLRLSNIAETCLKLADLSSSNFDPAVFD